MTGEGVPYVWTLDELLDEARALVHGRVIPEGCTVAVEADAEAGAVLLVGRRLDPPQAGVVMVDMDAVNVEGARLPQAVDELLGRLESPLLPACGPDDRPPVELHIMARGDRLPVRILNGVAARGHARQVGNEDHCMGR